MRDVRAWHLKFLKYIYFLHCMEHTSYIWFWLNSLGEFHQCHKDRCQLWVPIMSVFCDFSTQKYFTMSCVIKIRLWIADDDIKQSQRLYHYSHSHCKVCWVCLRGEVIQYVVNLEDYWSVTLESETCFFKV